MPMSMIAPTANFEVPNVTTEKKPLPKAKEQGGARFDNVLKRVSNNKDSKISKSDKPSNSQSQDSTPLNDSLPSIGLLLSEADQEKLINELNVALEEMGISLLEELGTQDLVAIDEMVAALFNETANSRQDVIDQDLMGEEIKQIILAQLFNAKPESNNSVVFDDGAKISVNTGKETSLELVANLSKQDIKLKTSSESNDFRLLADKVLTKTDNTQSQTDIKKLISTEISRINGVKSSTTPNNTLMTEQPVVNEEETSAINPAKLESLETKLDTKVFQTTTHNNRPVEVKEIIDQIVQKAELLLKQNASEIRINLKPEFLGKMAIKIVVEEGILTAKFITDNLQVKHLLESNLNTLRQSLESQGIRVEKTEVNVQLNNGGMFDGSENGRESSGERPENMVHYRGNDSEEIFNLDEEFTVAEKELGSGYLEAHEEGALSFLI
ncbi:MAG: hypothetical protein GX790_01775 [Syntrophomonadaceae bacterium]|nr:hypothetical protein [Syntrophomonadaceae bacterium]